MPLNVFRRIILPTAILLAGLVLISTVLFRYWISPPLPRAASNAPPASSALVDEQPLATARRLAAFATTPEEQDLAKNALRLADHEVDLTFAAALRNATLHPSAIPAAARPLLATVQALQEKVKAKQKRIDQRKQEIAQAPDSRKPALQEELNLGEATLEVDQEDLEAAQQELIRAGGDPRSVIQQLLDQHEAVEHAPGASQSLPPAKTSPPEVNSRTMAAQFRGWQQLGEKAGALAEAREEVAARRRELAHRHDELQRAGQAGATNAVGTPAAPAAPTAGAAGKSATKPAQASPEVYTALKQAAEARKRLADLDKRAADLAQLDTLYLQWQALLKARKQDDRRGLLEGGAWIVLLLLIVFFAGRIVAAMVAHLGHEGRRGHTVRTVARLILQAGGIALILLVMFGPPSQLATVLALAGAGLTVALKDFIVGFFGWFVLMGPNGIRPGDWVEIEGTGGEVIEVGLLHTIILETGNWSDAGHPTGRKVSFVNSFAIEGHYFNFSTTGQWLWDEVEVPVPAGADPYPIAEAVHKAVAAATESNVRLAEQEWQRAVPGHVGRAFAPVPAISVRPTASGVNVIVRYITRAHERHEMRTRLFHKIVEILRGPQVAPPLEAQAAKFPAGAE